MILCACALHADWAALDQRLRRRRVKHVIGGGPRLFWPESASGAMTYTTIREGLGCFEVLDEVLEFQRA
ncbi:hypothetical protein ACVWXO_003070 [Bradyrhizobium sp. LM2.7]